MTTLPPAAMQDCVTGPSSLEQRLDESIASAKRAPRRRWRPSSDPAAPENVARAVVTGAPIPPGAEQSAERFRRYYKRHPCELRRIVIAYALDLRGVAMAVRHASPRPRGAGRPAARAARRGGDSGDSHSHGDQAARARGRGTARMDARAAPRALTRERQYFRQASSAMLSGDP
jgi:hypothetical protein